ncbi:MAG: ABC transporter ATP-binding protein [Alistipes sp.]|nr:ABC transporter ATP-binding protein [Alistipes sp.]
MENTIELEHVCKFYGKKRALADINLTIRQGMFGLLGRNGAGKTTLMKTLAALHEKKSGKITVCGIPIEQAGKIREITGYLPQDFSMYPNMSVYECLDYLGALSGMSREARGRQIDSLLKKVNLTEQRRKKVKALSGGMKRRLGIAQALLHDPKVLIVDEPTAGLDPEERIRFRNLLCEVAEERIVILSTHIVGDIEATCENIAILNEGEILFQGTVSGLLGDAQERVYSVTVEKKDLPRIKKHYIVTGMLSQGSSVKLRLISENVPEIAGAVLEEPNCEDAYMYCLWKNGCDVEGVSGGEW